MSQRYCQFPGVPARIPGSCSPRANLPTLYLDQAWLELELVLTGSYENTQTSALGPASAFRFHYMAAQDAELSARLRVGLGFGALPTLGQLQLLRAPLRPTPGPCGLASHPPVRPPSPWQTGRITRSLEWAGGLPCLVRL